MKKNVLCCLCAVLMLLSVTVPLFTACSGETAPPVPDQTSAPSADVDDPDDTEETEPTRTTEETEATEGQTSAPAKETKVNIRPAEAKQVTYETYDNGMVSFSLPKGWRVDVPAVGFASYTFKAYDPQFTDRAFLFCLKLTGFLKSEAARAAFADLYPASLFGRLSAIEPQTTEAFYNVWHNNAALANTEQIKRDYFPLLQDFTLIENMGQLPLGGDVLRATCTAADGGLLQGLFTASVSDAGSYFMYGHDFAPLNVYHTVMMMAPDAEFNDWLPVMDHCIGTVQFSDAFMQGFYREENTMVATVQANQKIYDEISGMIMDSWEKRSNSYDIISQKRSDATLGCERVYDTETGDVYKAYNGFTDAYGGDRYRSATDDMYTAAISGYIEKVGG